MRRAVAVLGAAALGLAGCGGSRVVGGENAFGFPRTEAIYAFSAGEALADIQGDPFGGDHGAFVARVVEAMQGRTPGAVAQFVTRLSTPNPHGYRVVIVFNPADSGLPGRICRQTTPVAPPVAGPPHRIYAEAAFCRGGGDLTTARGWLDEAKGLDDPQLRYLAGDLTSALFPSGQSESDFCGGPDC